MPLPFASPFQRLPKRKLSGSVADLPLASSSSSAPSSSSGGSGSNAYDEIAISFDDPANEIVKENVQKRSLQSGRRAFSDDSLKTKSPSSGMMSPPSNTTSWRWFCGVCKTVDIREVTAFMVWEALTVLIVVLAVADWIFFFKYVVAPEDPSMRAKYAIVWVTFTALLLYMRRYMRSLCGAPFRALQEHAEIFVTVSLVMVFSTNVAFYLHAPSSEPLRDLGFLLIPAQTEDSKWRPLSDLMTALLPVFFMIQSYLMTRENRCHVMMTFFRVATVSYGLRTLTVSLTSLPGPAPHCRPGSPLYFPPETWVDVVTRVGPMYGKFFSCGDLIFSGHMAYTNSALLLYLRTLDRYFVRFSTVRWLVGGLYLVVLAALCISGRKHYTVDVVLGIIISTLVFFHFEHSWVPVSFQHPDHFALLLSRHNSGRRRGAASPASTVSARSRKGKFDVDLYEGDGSFDDHGGGMPLKRIVIVDSEQDEDRAMMTKNYAGGASVDFIC